MNLSVCSKWLLRKVFRQELPYQTIGFEQIKTGEWLLDVRCKIHTLQHLPGDLAIDFPA